MEQVKFIPTLEIGEIQATILLSYEDKVVLLSQERICVAFKDGEVYRPYPELKALDLHYFLHFGI